MPALESRIRSRLKGTPDVASLVSGQIYGGYAPQAASGDYLVLQRISTTPLTVISPLGTNSNGDVQARIQIDCIANPKPSDTRDVYFRVKAIADAVRASLHGWSEAGAKITSCLLANEIDDTEPPGDGSNVATQRVIQDYIIWFQ